MAEIYRAASTRLEPVTLGGRLAPVTLQQGGGASVRAPQVNPNAGNVTFTPVPVPQPVIDNTIDAVGKFAGIAMEAAFRYEDREATVFADDAKVKYSAEMRDLFFGREEENGRLTPGYGDTQTVAATKGHGSFEERVQDRYDEILENMEPRVRAKALVGMSAVRATALNRGAKHRVAQLEKYKEIVRFEKQKDAERDLVYTPFDALVPDSNGKTIKDHFFEGFETYKEALPAWQNAVVNTAKSIYVDEDQGPAAYKLFMDQIGSIELGDSTFHKKQLDVFENSKRLQVVRDKHSARTVALKESKLILDRNQTNYAIDIRQKELDGALPKTESHMLDLIKSQLVSEAWGYAYIDEHYGEFKRRTTPEALKAAHEKIAENAKVGFKDGKGNTTLYDYVGDPNLKSDGIAKMSNWTQVVKNPNTSDRALQFERFMKTYDLNPMQDQYMQGAQRDRYNDLYIEAYEYATLSFQRNGKYQDAKKHVEETIGLRMKMLNYGTFWNQTVPETMTELRFIRQELESDYKAKANDVTTEEIYNREIRRFEEYYRAFKQLDINLNKTLQ